MHYNNIQSEPVEKYQTTEEIPFKKQVNSASYTHNTITTTQKHIHSQSISDLTIHTIKYNKIGGQGLVKNLCILLYTYYIFTNILI